MILLLYLHCIRMLLALKIMFVVYCSTGHIAFVIVHDSCTSPSYVRWLMEHILHRLGDTVGQDPHLKWGSWEDQMQVLRLLLQCLFFIFFSSTGQKTIMSSVIVALTSLIHVLRRLLVTSHTSTPWKGMNSSMQYTATLDISTNVCYWKCQRTYLKIFETWILNLQWK
jgi:hypothetical protein